MGEYEYFLYSVVGADLFGVMPREIKEALIAHVEKHNLTDRLHLKHTPEMIFDDHRLKDIARTERQTILSERALIMRDYARQRAYLTTAKNNASYIKGSIFYPKTATMLANIAAYRRIVLDQSFNLGKNTFGTQADAIPFTFRSDGTIRNGFGKIIPTGAVIDSRQWNK